jgi:hypothetical protein
MPNIKTTTGQVSEYGLACGYIQQSKKGTKKVELYREHNTFFVVMSINGTIVVHEEFYSRRGLKRARTLYRELIKFNF